MAKQLRQRIPTSRFIRRWGGGRVGAGMGFEDMSINYHDEKDIVYYGCCRAGGRGRLCAQSFQLGIKGGGNLDHVYRKRRIPIIILIHFRPVGMREFLRIFGWGIISPLLRKSCIQRREHQIKTTTFREQSERLRQQSAHISLMLSIPVMAKVRFTGGFYLETGPEVNFNVSGG